MPVDVAINGCGFTNRGVGALFGNTERLNPNYHASLITERKFGSKWNIQDHDEVRQHLREMGKDWQADKVATSVLDGLQKLPWERVPYDPDNPAMSEDCEYYMVSREDLSFVFPMATQDIWTLDWVMSYLDTSGGLIRRSDSLFPWDFERIQTVADFIQVERSDKTMQFEMRSPFVEPLRISDLPYNDPDFRRGVHLRAKGFDGDPAPGAWLVVGTAEVEGKDGKWNKVEGESMVHCVYPGDLTPQLPEDWNGQIVNLFKRHSESDHLFTTLPYTIKKDEVHQ